MDAATLARLLGKSTLPAVAIEGIDLALPGVKVQAKKASLKSAGQGILLKLER